MKKIFLLCVCISILFSQSADDFYQKALEFEKNGDFKNAMKYYKMSAKESLNFENKLQKEITYEEKLPILGTKTTTREEFNNKILEDDLSSIKVHKPNYFVFSHDFNDKKDRKKNEGKFQISLEKPLSHDLFGLNERISFAYSQQSFWQIMQDSAPFRENNYEPEIFVTIPNKISNYDFIDWLRFGINHKSNGMGGIKSRSWNRAYVSAKITFGNLSITPRIWHSFKPDKYNKDINNYMGYGDIEILYDIYGHKLATMLRNNLNFNGKNRGAIEFSWYFPLFKDTYGYLQYFNGYGESLIDYKNHINKLGLGLAILK